MLEVAAIVAFGFAGACLRRAVAGFMTSRAGSRFPVGILVVNLSGSFALGLLTGVAARESWPGWLVGGLGVGAIGAYTTYSTWANDSVSMWGGGLRRASVVNLAGSLLAGVAVAALGIALGRAW